MAKAKKKSEISLEALLEAGCHFGHQSRRWNPQMEPYLYGVREGVHVFDLVKTKENLEEALDFVKEVTAKGGEVLFVGTKRQAKAVIKEEAKKIGAPFVSERWLGGTITNWGQIKKSIKKLHDLREKKEEGEFEKYTKKENILIDREIARLERFFGGLTNLDSLPEAIFIVDVKKEKAAAREARMRGIKVIGIVDSNADPDLVDSIIPANDDAIASIKLIVEAMAGAVRGGKELFEKKKKKEEGK
jgi:small subunit ribosomal protein S2